MGVCGSAQVGQDPLSKKPNSPPEESKAQTEEEVNNTEEEKTELAVESMPEIPEIMITASPEPEIQSSQEEEQEEEEEADDPEKASDFVFEIEKAEDEVQISAFKHDYPPPKPSRSGYQSAGTDILWFNNWSPQIKDDMSSDFDEGIRAVGSRPVTTITTKNVNLTIGTDEVTIHDVDRHARQAPQNVNKSFSELVKYLTDNLQHSHQREMLTARAIIVWLGNQNFNKMAGGTGNTETPEGYLILLGQRKTTYSTFFTVLCREAGIVCVQIKGVAKCGSYVPGDRDLSNLQCVWNAIHIEGNWNIVHPFWTCVSLFGHNAGGWIKVESGGQTVGKRQKASAGVLRNAFKEYYFMPNPMEFIYECHPNDEKWQLTEKSVSREEFIELPYLLPTFFGLGLKLRSQQKCLLKSKNGSLSIELEAPLKNANSLNMWYELFLKEGSSGSGAEDDMCTPEKIPRLVTMIRNGEEWQFNMQFPVEGTYKLCLYGGPYKTPLLRVSEFRIDCERRKKTCVLLPFNPGIVGFGPGPTAEEAGLFVPSHRSGFISTKIKNDIKIMFHVDSYILRYRNVKSELINNESEERTRIKCNFMEDKKLLKIITSVPQDGEYSLTISTGSRKRFVSVDEEKDSYRNVCNYYVSTLENSSHEKTSQRLARKALEDAYEGDDIEKLQNGIDKCIREKIDPNDDQILASTARMEFLKSKKVLRDAYMRRNTEIVVKALEYMQTNPYKGALKGEIIALEKLRKRLETMGAYTQRVPEIQESLQELEYKVEPKSEICDTLQALFLLLGEPERSMTSWSDIARLVHPTSITERTAFHRMKDVQEGRKGINIENARKADRLLHKHTLDEVKHVNMAAATIYHWTDVVLRTCFDIHEGKDDI